MDTSSDPKEQPAHDSIEQAVQHYAKNRPSGIESTAKPARETAERKAADQAEIAARMADIHAIKPRTGPEHMEVTDAFHAVMPPEDPALMDERRVKALRSETNDLHDDLRRRGFDVGVEETKSFMGRMFGGLRAMVNPEVRRYQEKMALLNKLIEAQAAKARQKYDDERLRVDPKRPPLETKPGSH